MATTIDLYKFAKKQNSTARPSSGALSLSGDFRQPLDVLRPVVVVEDSGLYSISTGYNYAHISQLARYYWIRNMVWISDKLVELHLEVDVLATYKVGIGSSNQYITRCAYTRDDKIVDMLYPISTNNTVQVEDISSDLPWMTSYGGSMASGCYVIGLVNNDNSAVGAVSYYALNQAGMRNMRQTLLSTTPSYTGMTYSDIEEALYKSLFNPMQYIASCMWFPIEPPNAAASSLTMQVGFFPVTFGAGSFKPLTSTTQEVTGTLSTINHPQISDGAYFNAAPFTKRTIYAQPFGVIPLDCSKLMETNHVLKTKAYVDFITGKATLRIIENTSGTIVAEASAQLGVPVQLAQVTQDILGFASNAVSGTVSTGTNLGMGNISGAMASASNAIINCVEAIAPTVSGGGSNGSLLAFDTPAHYEVQFFRTPTPDNLDNGSPLCVRGQISSYAGATANYLKIHNPHVALTGAFISESQQVEALMAGGFFYE